MNELNDLMSKLSVTRQFYYALYLDDLHQYHFFDIFTEKEEDLRIWLDMYKINNIHISTMPFISKSRTDTYYVYSVKNIHNIHNIQNTECTELIAVDPDLPMEYIPKNIEICQHVMNIHNYGSNDVYVNIDIGDSILFQ